jgi:predicted metal-binding protein
MYIICMLRSKQKKDIGFLASKFLFFNPSCIWNQFDESSKHLDESSKS